MENKLKMMIPKLISKKSDLYNFSFFARLTPKSNSGLSLDHAGGGNTHAWDNHGGDNQKIGFAETKIKGFVHLILKSEPRRLTIN